MNTTQQAIHITDNACEKIHTLISGEKTHDDESLFRAFPLLEMAVQALVMT